VTSSEITLKQRLLSAGAWALAGRVLTVVGGVAVNALVARLLAPEALGAYFLTVSMVSVFSVIAQFGLAQTSVRLIAASTATGRVGRAAKTVRLALRYGALGAAIVAAILILGLGNWLARQVFDSVLLAGVVGLTAIWVVIATLQGLLAEAFRGFHDIRLATTFEGTLTTVLSAFLFAGLWMIQGHSDLRQIMVLSIIAGFTNTLLAGLLMHSRLKSIGSNDQLRPKEVLQTAWPLLVTNLTIFVFMQADLWIIGIFRTHQEVAMYGAALRLVKIVILPLAIVNAVIAPHIATLYAQERRRELQLMLRASATLASIPALLALLMFTLFGGPTLALVYGDYYRGAAPILVLLSLGQMVNMWTGSCAMILTMTRHEMAMMVIAVVSGLVTVSAAVLVVKPYGAVGVAAATATGIVLRNLSTLIYAKRRLDVWTHVSLAAIPMLKRAVQLSR
jgi:O-antigen/teichoic acid export membrane protein